MNKSETNLNDIELNNLIQRINFYYPITLSSIATIGNILSFLVFSSRVFQNNASSFYLRCKAFTDILNVYIGTLRFSYSAQNSGADLKDLNPVFCYFFGIGVYTIDPFTSWLNVFTSLDRLVLVLKPSFYKSISNQALRRFQILLIFATFCVVLLLNLIKAFYLSFVVSETTINGTNQTSVTRRCVSSNAITLDWLNLAITLIIPFVIMTASSSIMGYNLIKSKSKINKSRSKNSGFWSKNIAFIKTVVCLDIFFLAFNLPRFILQLLKLNTFLYTFELQLSTVFKYSYYSLTIVFYLTTNSLFRDTLIERFCLVLNKSKIVVYKKRMNKVRPIQEQTH